METNKQKKKGKGNNGREKGSNGAQKEHFKCL
jgi:hypothetical protein